MIGNTVFGVAPVHAEDRAKRRAGKLRTDEVVVQHDEQAVDAKVHHCGAIAVLRAEVDLIAGILQKRPIPLEAVSAEDKARNDAQRKQSNAVRIDERLV